MKHYYTANILVCNFDSWHIDYCRKIIFLHCITSKYSHYLYIFYILHYCILRTYKLKIDRIRPHRYCIYSLKNILRNYPNRKYKWPHYYPWKNFPNKTQGSQLYIIWCPRADKLGTQILSPSNIHPYICCILKMPMSLKQEYIFCNLSGKASIY